MKIPTRTKFESKREELPVMSVSEELETLKKKISAYETLVKSQESQLSFYRKQWETYGPKLEKIEAELESQRQMNEILTQELENEISKNGG